MIKYYRSSLLLYIIWKEDNLTYMSQKPYSIGKFQIHNLTYFKQQWHRLSQSYVMQLYDQRQYCLWYDIRVVVFQSFFCVQRAITAEQVMLTPSLNRDKRNISLLQHLVALCFLTRTIWTPEYLGTLDNLYTRLSPSHSP